MLVRIDRFLVATFLLTAFLMAGSAGTAMAAASGGDLALCVGINGYSRMGALRYCVNDAHAVKLRLEDSGSFRRVKVLADSDENGNPAPVSSLPTANNILANLRQLSTLVSPENSILFFFSGHGIERDGVKYLVPIDGDETSALSLDDVKNVLAASRARNKLIILDACRSGLGAKGLAGVRGAMEEEGLAILVSCGADQFSYEVESSGRGLFSLVLEEGLSGKADLDADDFISGDELFQYLDRGMGDYCLDNDILTTQTPEINAAGRDANFLRIDPEVRAGRERERERLEAKAREGRELQARLQKQEEAAERERREREARTLAERRQAEARQAEEAAARQREEEARRGEDALYAAATDEAGCESYLNSYPYGRYADEVRRRLDGMRFNVFGGWQVTIYDTSSRGMTYMATISMENGRMMWREQMGSYRSFGGYRLPSSTRTQQSSGIISHSYRNGVLDIHFDGESLPCTFSPIGGGVLEHYHEGGRMTIKKAY